MANSGAGPSLAILYPGASSSDTGTLTVGTDTSNTVSFGRNSVLRLDIGAAGASDMLAINGNLNIGTEATLDLLSLAGAWDGTPYTIVTFTGTRTGTFVNVSGLDSSYSVQYNSNSIVLIPEPATVNMIGAMFAALLVRRRLRRG